MIGCGWNRYFSRALVVVSAINISALQGTAKAEIAITKHSQADGIVAAPLVEDLTGAACESDISRLNRALSLVADPNAQGVDGSSPLIWAVRCNSFVGVGALLDRGANPNHSTNSGETPVTIAAASPEPRILERLLAHLGNPNADEGQGWTALRIALEYGAQSSHWDNYYILLRGGADINLRSSGGLTIAFYAASIGEYKKAEELLQLGCDQNVVFLGAIVQQTEYRHGSRQFVEQLALKKYLESLGVHFPVPPLNEISPPIVR